MGRSRSTEQFSARWDAGILARLERRSEVTGTNKSRLAERYVDEGTRMDEHPGIVFRGGPTGRRAGLVAGPDVWEVISTIKIGETRGAAAIEAAANTLDLSPAAVQLAVAYYSDYPDEIDERVRATIEEADAAEAAWQRQQAALS